jgi:hypothetical protein
MTTTISILFGLAAVAGLALALFGDRVPPRRRR